MNNIDRAAELLFPVNGPQTLNVKFFCGGEPNISADEIAEQLVRAHVQIKAGTARRVDNVDQHLTPAD
ncbi:MAG: hypothetical protein ABIY37_14705 [Devosia sp.]